MIFLAGLLGVLQVGLLPGLIILRLARWRGSLLAGLALTFALSLLCSERLAFLLAAVGLFRAPLLWTILTLEVAALLWLYRAGLAAPFFGGLASLWEEGSAYLEDLHRRADVAFHSAPLAAALRLAMGCASLDAALYYLAYAAGQYVVHLGEVFNTWDAIMSWNRWAVEWTRGSLPLDLGLYPQLGPANWAWIYLLQGTSAVQLFAKAVLPLSFVGILLLQFDLARLQRSYGILLGLAFTYLAMRHFEGEFINDGYMDVPVAFLSFLSASLLLSLAPDASPAQARAGLWFSALAAAAAALTKQAGLYSLLIWPLLAWLLVLRSRPERLPARALWLPFLAALALALSFYLYRYTVIALGLDSDNTAYLLSAVHQGRSLLQRFQTGWGEMGRYAYLSVFCLAALIWQKPPYRWLTLAVLLPFSLLWALFYSYDSRNIALALPFLGLLAGTALEGLFEWGLALLNRLKLARIPAAAVLALAVLLAAGLGLRYTNTRLLADQDTARRQIFNPDLNRQLYAYIQANGLHGQILTNYPLEFLPDLQGSQRSFWYNEADVFLSEVENPNNGYLLVPANASDNVKALIQQKRAAGQLTLIFDSPKGYAYTFYKIEKKYP